MIDVTYDLLDELVDLDTIRLRDVAWAEIARLRRELDEARAERDQLRGHILDIDAHATPYGDIPDEPGWVGTYLLTAGALHRALGKIGHSAPKCRAEEDLKLTRHAFGEYRESWHRTEAALLTALEQMRPVVEAAEAWRFALPPSADQIKALMAAVDAFRSSTPDAEPAPGVPVDTEAGALTTQPSTEETRP